MALTKIHLLLTLTVLFSIGTAKSQSSLSQVDSLQVTSLEGEKIYLADIENGDEPILLIFWASWHHPAKKMLSSINELLEDWTDETGVKLIAISIDDERNKARVRPYIESKGWDFDVYFDSEDNVERTLYGRKAVPLTFIIDHQRNITYRHAGYELGDENEIYKLLQAL